MHLLRFLGQMGFGDVFAVAGLGVFHADDARRFSVGFFQLRDQLRALVGALPIFGICLGHQLLCRAVGLETYKLRFGHRGANHPVKDLQTGRIEITSQNHGFAVLGPDGERALAGDRPVRWETDFGPAELTHLNLYDRTVEGLRLPEARASTVQYHPEAGPGPHDALHLFDRFINEIRG